MTPALLQVYLERNVVKVGIVLSPRPCLPLFRARFSDSRTDLYRVASAQTKPAEPSGALERNLLQNLGKEGLPALLCLAVALGCLRTSGAAGKGGDVP